MRRRKSCWPGAGEPGLTAHVNGGRTTWWPLVLGLVIVVAVARFVDVPPVDDGGPVAVPTTPRPSRSRPPTPTLTVTPVAEGENPSAVFSQATDTVLIFDDGDDGAFAVQLDTGVRRHIRRASATSIRRLTSTSSRTERSTPLRYSVAAPGVVS